MHRYTIRLAATVDADSAEEAAMLAFQELVSGNAVIALSVTDETDTTTTVSLDRTKAEDFAKEDHTADPGNW